MAANSRLRERFLDACVTDGLRGFLPSWAMCTDNAAMVASAAWYRWQSDGPSPLDTGALPNLVPAEAAPASPGGACAELASTADGRSPEAR